MTGCSTTPGSATPCFSIQIDNSQFLNFGYLKTASLHAVWVDPTKNMQFYGSILDLDAFNGNIAIRSNLFSKNVLKYDNCDLAFNMD